MFTDEENKAINASTLLAKKVEKLIKYQTNIEKATWDCIRLNVYARKIHKYNHNLNVDMFSNFMDLDDS